ncbi:hypothetical protein BH09PSE5_BH09PSE5_14550 [soil metagenome]
MNANTNELNAASIASLQHRATAVEGIEDIEEAALSHKAAKGAGIGAGVGGFLGAVIAAIAAAVTSIALPGFGVLMAGPLAAAVIGAGAGAANGTLVGALIGWGIPEERQIYA